MEPFSIEKAKQGCTVKTRCGYDVQSIKYDTCVPELPIAAVVMEVITEGRGRKKKTRIEPNLVLYHPDGRLYEDQEDGFDLVIEQP